MDVEATAGAAETVGNAVDRAAAVRVTTGTATALTGATASTVDATTTAASTFGATVASTFGATVASTIGGSAASTVVGATAAPVSGTAAAAVASCCSVSTYCPNSDEPSSGAGDQRSGCGGKFDTPDGIRPDDKSYGSGTACRIRSSAFANDTFDAADGSAAGGSATTAAAGAAGAVVVIVVDVDGCGCSSGWRWIRYGRYGWRADCS